MNACFAAPRDNGFGLRLPVTRVLGRVFVAVGAMGFVPDDAATDIYLLRDSLKVTGIHAAPVST